MDIDNLLESLLNEEESSTLDFKREQYKFHGADRNEKSELLKDILAFANAWRRSDAYILVGVEEVKGGENKMVGIEESLDDADLQIFVSSKTQRPLDFSYREVLFRSVTLGIFQIPLQERPIYLKRDYGKLKRGIVYIRRGTSTVEANPDEVAEMGRLDNEVPRSSPILSVRLCKPDTHEILSEHLIISVTALSIPADEMIPEYGTFNLGSMYMAQNLMENRKFYLDVAKYMKKVQAIKPFRVGITNAGEGSANGVRIELKMHDPDNTLIVYDEDSHPMKPSSYKIPLFRTNSDRAEDDVAVTRRGQTWHVEADVDRIQPKRTVYTNSRIYIGSETESETEIQVTIYASNLQEPVKESLKLRIEVKRNSIDIDQLRNISMRYK